MMADNSDRQCPTCGSIGFDPAPNDTSRCTECEVKEDPNPQIQYVPAQINPPENPKKPRVRTTRPDPIKCPNCDETTLALKYGSYWVCPCGYSETH